MRCQGQTKNGHSCTRSAQCDSRYCWQHQKNYKSPQRSPQKMSSSDEKLQRKFCSCVMKVKQKSPQVNPWAICSKSVGRVSNSCKQYEV